jgi:hypothetical protein
MPKLVNQCRSDCSGAVLQNAGFIKNNTGKRRFIEMMYHLIVCDVDSGLHIFLRSADIYLYAEFLTLSLCLTCNRKGSDNNDRLSGMLYNFFREAKLL